MKVHVKRGDNDRIYIKFGWNKRAEAEFIRLAKHPLFCAFEGWDNSTLIYNSSAFSCVAASRHLSSIIAVAQTIGIPVSTHVKKKARDLIKQAKEETKDWKLPERDWGKETAYEIIIKTRNGITGEERKIKVFNRKEKANGI